MDVDTLVTSFVVGMASYSSVAYFGAVEGNIADDIAMMDPSLDDCWGKTVAAAAAAVAVGEVVDETKAEAEAAVVVAVVVMDVAKIFALYPLSFAAKLSVVSANSLDSVRYFPDH